MTYDLISVKVSFDNKSIKTHNLKVYFNRDTQITTLTRDDNEMIKSKKSFLYKYEEHVQYEAISCCISTSCSIHCNIESQNTMVLEILKYHIY